ncbi:MAG TPA: hypothetical protein VGK00_03210 [Anaerolineales bacterium]|jgi:hypothetical protein
MPRRSSLISIEENPGQKYPDLRTAQKNAAQELAPGIAGTMRALLADGWLIVKNGMLIPNPERSL